MAGWLTCVNVVQGVGHTVQAFEEIIVVDPLSVGSDPVLVARDADGWVHLLDSGSCRLTLHLLHTVETTHV